MSQHIRRAIEREEAFASLWRELKPEESALADLRAQELREELDQAFLEEMTILSRHEQQAKPVPRPQSFLQPMGMDESLEGRWVYDDQTHLRRPL